jgi:hypothetical protein
LLNAADMTKTYPAFKYSIGMSIALGALVCVACTQSQSASGTDDEATATTHEALAETGCETVALHPPQQGGPGNDGIADTGLVDNNCTTGSVVVTNSSYPGDASCPNQAIYELGGTSGIWHPSVNIPSSAMPTTQSDCNIYFAYGVYAMDPSQGNNWVLLGTATNQTQWFSNQCGYGTWGGNAPWDLDLGKYPKIRIAAEAWRGSFTKGLPVATSWIPVAVTVDSQYCIW